MSETKHPFDRRTDRDQLIKDKWKWKLLLNSYGILHDSSTNLLISSKTRSGISSSGTCPHFSIVTSFEFLMSEFILRPASNGISASSAPQIINVGVLILPKSC